MIPRVLHQIWLGPEPPEAVQRCLDSVREKHPGWTYRLWTDENRPRLDSENEFRRAPSFAMKADLLRYELLFREGGIYVDADFFCHRALDPLLEDKRDKLFLSEFGVICNGLLGCAAGDPFFASLVEEARARMNASDARGLDNPHMVTGPYLVDELFVRKGIADSEPLSLLAGDFFFAPRTRVASALELAAEKRYMSHLALATWRREGGITAWARRTKLRTRLRRFVDLSAP